MHTNHQWPAGSTRTERGGTIRAEGAAIHAMGARLITILLLVVAVGATACTASGSKAGGDIEPIVLTLADGYENPAFTPAVTYFIRRVEELSGGEVRVEDVQGWGELQPDFEQQIVRDVAAGEADLGWVGTRIFDTFGVTSFQALTAPMLIDSYPLEEAVITSSIPSEMLEGLDALDVTGLAVFGDGLRKPIAQDRPLLSASDWEGVLFNVFRSEGQTAAIAALGAEPTDIGFGDVPYTAAERNLIPYRDNYVTRFPYVTANVNLWPQTVALIANPDRLSRLTSEQRGWVEAAAQDATARSIGFVDHDQDIVTYTCARGARYAQASEADLTSLRKAFDGVYADLEQDAQTRTFIEQIQAMKSSVPAAPTLQIPADCNAVSAEAQANDPLQGTWETEPLTEGEIVHAFVAAGGTESDGHAFFAQSLGGGATKSVVLRLEFANGGVDLYESADGGGFIHGDGRSYSLDGDTVTMVSGDGCVGTYSVDIQGDTLRMQGSECAGHDQPYGSTVYGGFPFTRRS